MVIRTDEGNGGCEIANDDILAFKDSMKIRILIKEISPCYGLLSEPHSFWSLC